MTKNYIAFCLIGQYPREAVETEWAEQTRPVIAEIEAAIEQAWQQARERVGIKLFDGPMCRLESFEAGKRLRLRVSRTSYKPFLGTNLTHPEFAERYGPGALANPIGLSAALETSDGVMMLGRRSARLAYYPGRVHPFAGALEPGEKVDIFADMTRELQEELGLAEGDLREMTVVGLVEDLALRQPEVIFHVRCGKTQREIQGQLDAEEHTASVAVKAERAEVQGWLANPALTPVACAALLLWGRSKWGAEWFDAAGRAVTLRG